jgi:hypothetical protein
MRRPPFFLTLSILSLSACIDPIDLRVETEAGKLVVEGLVTNQPGVYSVKLARSLSFNTNRKPPAYVLEETGASVVIEDSDEQFVLEEIQDGVYATAAFTGQPGETYRLKITTADGKQYQSYPETMPQPHPIDTLHYQYKVIQDTYTNTNGSTVVRDAYGFALSVISTDPAQATNYYRWKVSGIFEFFSLVDDITIRYCWAPVFRIEPWVKVATDKDFNGNQFTQELAFIRYDRETKFLARVEQHTLTPEAYTYWKMISDQQVNTGSIFDPAPARIRGNMISLSDENEVVLGFFQASAITKDSIMIDRFKASGYVSASPRIEPLPGDCRNHWPWATNVRPPGF